MKHVRMTAALCAGLALQPASALGAAQRPLQTVFVCETTCRTTVIQDAAPADPFHNAPYPRGVRSGLVEGLVKVSFDVQPDGQTANLAVVTQFGPQELADAALAATQAQRYSPATENGAPIVSPGHMRIFTFSIEPAESHADFDRAFADARDLVAKGRQSEAADALKALLKQPRASLFEDAAATYELAVTYLRLNDFERALQTINDAALIAMARPVSDTLKYQIKRIHMVAAANAHHYREALDAYNDMTPPGPPADSGDRDAAAQISAIIDAKAAIAVRGAIPGSAPWLYKLVRGRFAISAVAGAVTRYTVACNQTSREAPSGTMAGAQLPASWGDCTLAVFGMPGTTFALTDG